nr:PadR family transcriptional regulator [Rhodococcus sp. (in: high G+C Gram-positive bacteria)]
MGTKSLTPLGIAVLALLAEGPMHPYEMYQLLVSRKEDRIVKIRPGSLYHAVDRLAEKDLVRAVGTDREGNRPERTTYEVTGSGRRALTDEISETLAMPVAEYPRFVLALSEMHNIQAAEAISCLRTRIEHKSTEDAELAEIEDVVRGRGVPPIFFVGIGYMRTVIAAEVTWLRQFTADVESGRIPWLTDDMATEMAARRAGKNSNDSGEAL